MKARIIQVRREEIWQHYVNGKRVSENEYKLALCGKQYDSLKYVCESIFTAETVLEWEVSTDKQAEDEYPDKLAKINASNSENFCLEVV